MQITRSPNGDLIVHPCPAQRGQALLDTLAGFEPTFMASLEAQQASPSPAQVAERIDRLADVDSLAMSFIPWAELLRGAEGSQRREVTLQQLDALPRQVPVLNPDGPAICRHYAVQATALSLGATLVSHNVREFAHIEGLALVDGAAAA